MYKKQRPTNSDIVIDEEIQKGTGFQLSDTVEGETIEEKCARITTNGEPIKDGAPIIYTDRKNGVDPMHNIRTDRFEIALDAMTMVTKSHLAQRENYAKQKEEKSKQDLAGTADNSSDNSQEKN